ncbi:LysR family transcriptional regulator [Lentzea sp. NBRC 105346]|uniref:LysR family transcriptional regulator n=1 Tax=Lentzea sp. NBRC 105346 TaxID=3032205 RepID=UPI0024A54278|nr:LysR family transcriptional regulator [Lentzea sp. NBRC 105346]GLZ33507.1 LysR family transcriptional regulator [Lentzea sp. NBRC 105346]
MKLELRHLRVICAIAEAGSLSKASAVLGLAQPALTAQLQRLESLVGGRLFDRDRRGARPTALGELVLERAKILLPAITRLEEDVQKLAERPEPDRIRIGAVNGPFLGGIVHRLTEDHANVSTQVSWSADELARGLDQGRLDCAIIGVCGNDTAPEGWVEIATDPVFVLLPEEHPFSGDLAELKDMQWAATPGDGCFGDCFARACDDAGFTPKPLYEVDVMSCVDLVQAGKAVALCQPTFRKAAGLEVRPINGTPLRWRHFMGNPTERIMGYAAEAYVEAAERNPRYVSWLLDNPGFGVINGCYDPSGITR